MNKLTSQNRWCMERPEHLYLSSKPTFEGIEVVLRIRPTSTVRIVTIYCPPSSGKNTTPFSEFITEFSHVLDHAATRPTEYVIVGDFNVHYDDLR